MASFAETWKDKTMSKLFFPAEWHPQSGVQLTWPHANTDWADILDEVTACYIAIAKEILKREKLLVVCENASSIKGYFTEQEQNNLLVTEQKSNDTWARDHGAISIFDGDTPTLVDFGYNAWGLKFAANYDNQITKNIFDEKVFKPEVAYRNRLDFILEGGSIESDGKGTILTTTDCLTAPNRNQPMTRDDVENYLKKTLGANRVLFLDYGYLAGDDTDNHIDTLARFCNENTIAYVQCTDENDEHYPQLRQMEQQLRTFTTPENKVYNLVALPMAEAVYEDGYRLPATYANFLIINQAVLLPFYNTETDKLAKEVLQKVFPQHEIVGINCSSLIKQHGSLHCATMQFPAGFL